MGQADTQLISSLQALVQGTKAIAAGVPRASYEVWLPPIVTVLGWGALVWLNQWNNRDLLKLQRKELATNRILDGLDSYLQFLADARKPARLLFRDVGAFERRPTFLGSDTHGMDLKVSLNAMRLTLASLTFSDAKKRWVEVLYREAWTYNKRQSIVRQVEALEKSHKTIMSDLIDFETKLAGPDTQESSSRPGTISWDRDQASVKRIEQQQAAVVTLYVELNTPGSAARNKITKKALSEAISQRLEIEDVRSDDAAP